MNQLEAIVESRRTGKAYLCNGRKRKVVEDRIYQFSQIEGCWCEFEVCYLGAPAEMVESEPIKPDLALKRRTMEFVR